MTKTCEVKGCEKAATWERFFGGRMAFVCGDCRRAFQDANTPDPELEEVQDNASGVPVERKPLAMVVDTVPEVRHGGPADTA